MKTKITTDWHVAVKRVGGTTPESQTRLRNYLRQSLQAQLDNTDHLIAGDLLDDFTIDSFELTETYKIFSAWLLKYGKKLALVRGNHDWKPSGENRYSSFDLITSILKQHFPEQVTVASTVTEWKQFILVPHLANSDILNLEISKLKDVSNKVIVFHANVGNFFAAETQHSLNLTMEQVEDLVSRDNLVIFGHEHQYRSLVSGRCVVLGNTAPSSIADCIGSPFKYAALLTGTEYELIPAWDHLNSYIEADWRNLADIEDYQYNFIRVVGNATALEAAAVIKAVSQLRQRSEAYVISNSVRVEGQDMTMNTESIESIRAFDVLSAIFAELNEREIETVKELMK